MEEATLYRYDSGDEGTFGVIVYGNEWLYTLELPWRDNRPDVSCIPAGEYNVVRRYSPSFKRVTYWIQDVEGRSYILIHGANFAGDVTKGWQSHLQGCITLGCVTATAKNKYGKVQKCVGRSREAISRLERMTGNKEFKLIIKDVYDVDNAS